MLNFRNMAMILLLSAVLAIGSCAIQRHGPEQAVYCDLGAAADCLKPVLNGGWPAPFAFDRPGISVEGKISIGEDEFRLSPFIANLGFYFSILLGLWLIIRPKNR